jgi:hypothetical protein
VTSTLSQHGEKNIDAYNAKGLKEQIMTFQKSRKTKNVKKFNITF